MKSNLILRSVTGAVFVLVVVGCIVLNPIAYAALFAVVTGMTIWEFCTLLNKNADAQINRFISTVAGVYLFLAMFMYHMGIVGRDLGAKIFVPYLVTIIYLFVTELYFDRKNSINNWAYTMMAQMYIALPMSCLSFLAYLTPAADGTYQYVYIYQLAVFFFLWASDSGAYCVGSLIGKRKLFPRISPNKSWEGSIGGGIVAVAVSQILATYFPIGGADNELYSRLVWAGLAVVVVVFGTWGDLVESLFKRKLGIKDSGCILPGHGGMLDRFDSSLLAIPAAVVYLYCVNGNEWSSFVERLSQLFGA
jgi:phosphatidate cytidylyltransferase